MPIVVLSVRPGLLPSPQDARRPVDRLIPTYQLTYHFKQMLAAAVVRVLNQVDGDSLTIDQVFLRVELLHPWCVNASDYMIDVQPKEIKGWFRWFGRRDRRRKRIAELLREQIEHFLNHQARWSEDDITITYDIDVRPISDSGSSTDKAGNVVRW